MHRQIIALALVVVSVGTARADEDSLTVVGGMDFGFKKLHLDTGSGAGAFNPSFVTINPNVTLAYNSFYAILSYDRSISAEPETGGTSSATVTDYSRTDSTFALGYRLNPSFNLFVGYTEGVNRFVTTTANVILIATDTTYTEKGPFAGASYTRAFGDTGNLTLSAAYGWLKGDLKVDVRPGSGSGSVTGDTKGLSLGLTWSGPLTGSLGYRVGLKGTWYEMKDPITIKERYTDLFVGILNYF
jgi:hypothetical protein